MIDDHSFDAGDHARETISPEHLCHDCGRPLSEHSRRPVWIEEADEPRPEPEEPPAVPTSTAVSPEHTMYDPGTSVTAPLPTPTEGVKTGAAEIPQPWRPPWWNRTPGPVIYEYDWFDWLIRLLFFALGLLIGFVAWHGVHLSFSI